MLGIFSESTGLLSFIAEERRQGILYRHQPSLRIVSRLPRRGRGLWAVFQAWVHFHHRDGGPAIKFSMSLKRNNKVR